MSLVLIGLCHGFNSNTRTFNGNTFVDNQVLVEVENQNQYGIPEVKTIAVKVSKKHMEQGLNNVWNQFKGKQVSVPVFVNAWASKAGNAGYDLILSGDGKPLNVQLVKAVQQAS
ncbi:DNA-binding protein [Pseudomonas anguilliseptica]|uniref:DNA-binding protein n=1 Tax=Pseudomonas anguilliseptica TaxID=53406 RepID=UPI00325AA717